MSEKHQIVIVGGGSAGITVAARLLKKQSNLDVTIIDPADKHYYQPLWTLVGGGVVSKEETERDQASVIPKGANWIQESVETFEPESSEVVLKSGKRVGYEFLIVAPGIAIHWDKIKGLNEALGKDGVCSNYAYDQVDKTFQFINAFQGGKALFTFPSTPIKCAGAPQKIMYLAEHNFRKRGIRDKCEVIYTSAVGAIFGVKKYAAALEKVIENRGIETCFKQDLFEIRGDSKEAVFRNPDTQEETVRKYDMIHVTPPMGAPDFVKPLANSGGWVDVDKTTLQHTKFANIFSLGDASSLPTSKTGAAIRKQAPVLVENLLSVMRGNSPSGRYNGYTSCPLVTSYGTVIMAEFDYDGNPQETFPFDQSKERYSMYFVKKNLLPILYWKGMLEGRA